MKEQKKKFYNKLYKKGGHNKEYFKSPEESIYYPLWDKIISCIEPESLLADFGCGAGQFASLAFAKNIHYVLGVDFSSKAIKLARTRNPAQKHLFVKSNLYLPKTYQLAEYDVALFSEVFEHLQDDLLVCSFVPKDKKLLISLPSFESESHVRFFKNEDEIIERYENSIRINRLEVALQIKDTDKKIYLMQGVKK